MFELLLLLTMVCNIAGDVIDRRVSPVSDPRALALWGSIVQLLLVCPFLLIVDWPGWPHLLLLAVVGGFSGFARERWYRALGYPHESLSRLIPFVRLSGVLVLALAVLVLGEPMTPVMAAGALLMIGAGFLISLERYGGDFYAFVHANRALVLVVVFATSNAFISVSYKYLLGREVSIVTIYFFLKLFQCLPLLAKSAAEGRLASSRGEIASPALFVVSRIFQTVAALVFLLVLYRLPLTLVEPLMALSPFLYLGWEWLERRYCLSGGAVPGTAPAKHVPPLRLAATGMTMIGLFLLHHN